MSRIITHNTLPALLALMLTPFFVWLDIGGQDFDTQFYAAGRGWPHIFDAVPIREVEKGGIFGIFLPWAIAVVQPFALLPLIWARALTQAGTLAALLLLAGSRPLAWLATLSSAPAILLIFHSSNLDAISALGVLLPPAGGLFLLAMKPQAAALAATVWLAERRWQAFIPMGVVILLSTLLWPEWLIRIQESPAGALNVSLFPWSLLLALPLLAWSIYRRDILLAALLTPLTMPYVAIYTLAPTIALLARRNRWSGFLANGVSWAILYLLMQRMAG